MSTDATSSENTSVTTNSVCSNASCSENWEKVLENYKVYVVTWNVGTRFPDNISLRNLLGLYSTTKQEELPDIYAVGLQEVNSQPTQQVLGFFKEDPWTIKIKKTLKEYDYVLAKTEQMQGLLCSIFVRRQHILQLRDIEAECTRTGFGGIWGNKGAVSIRFNLYGCALTFVSAHLAAHDQCLDERIEDYKHILQHHHYHVPRFREIQDHDYVFWFGDLNFRIDGDDSPSEVLEAVQEERFEALQQRDQLQHVRLITQEAFQFLQERTPAFPPTFKFKEGTCEYDLKRRPAWTDRILYAVFGLRFPTMPLEIEQCSYKSHPGYNISDHKPVTSEFTLKMFPNYRAPCIEFHDVVNWIIGKENTVEYLIPKDFEEYKHDWIGLFHADFASLGEEIAYEYVSQAETPPTPPDSPVDSYFDMPTTHRSGGHHHHHKPHCCREQTTNAERIRIDFSDDIELRDGERYLLIYFQNTGLRGITSVAGISNTFCAIKRRHSHSHND